MEQNNGRVPSLVTDMIKKYILDNKLTTGSQLPSENELSEKLNVCRASIREGMKILESSGVIESIQGKGRFIKEFNYEDLVENLGYSLKVNFKDLKDVVQVRKALESYFLPEIATNLDADDFSTMEQLIDCMQRQIADGVSFNELSLTHSEFHRCLYSKMNNKMLDSLISMFTVFQQVHGQVGKTDSSFIEKHKELISCLRNGDRKEIEKTMSKHFEDYDNL